MNGYNNGYNRKNIGGGNYDLKRRSQNGSYNRTNQYNGGNAGNSYYNNKNGDGNNNGYDIANTERKKPPREWRNFSEIKFRVSNLHTNYKASELVDAFAAYGSVFKIEIVTKENELGDEISTGVAYIIFKPVPSSSFWERPVRFHGRTLQVDYQKNFCSSDTFIDQADGKHKLKLHSFKAECLELGVYQQSDTFVSEAKYNDLVNFTINYQRRRINVEFCVKEFLFKLEIAFKDIEGDIYAELDDSQRRCRGSITITNKYPARYWVLDKNLKSKDMFNWYLDDSWMRRTEIRVTENEEKRTPLQPYMPNHQLGKWVVFRITFDLDNVGKTPTEGFDRFKQMVEKAGDYNLVSKPVHFNKPLKIVNGTDLRKYVSRSMLSFEVLYMVECNVSFNYLNNYNLNENFFNLLSEIPSKSAVDILEAIFEKKKRIYDPYSYLHEEVKAIGYIESRSRHVPHYCGMMRKVVVTPTAMYVLMPMIETSNRVIRYFLDRKDNFLRVQFVDEGLEKVGSTNTGNRKTKIDLYKRVYHVLRDGIKIGDRHYEFLAFSASQLRDHSCWFFAPTDDLTANDVRDWMGNFSTNKSVAKYAARMGQCFSSTRAIRRLPVSDIKEIKDVTRNGFTFSDGVGNISQSLAKTIANELGLTIVPSAFQFRLAGYKGVLCQSKSVKEDQIQVRPSQHKFESDHHMLEVIRCSTFISAFLNRQAITLLSALGIPDEVFIEMKDLRVNELDKMLENENTALDVLQKNVDEYGISSSLADLVRAGFLKRKDRYLMNLISLFRTMTLRDLKKKAKIRVDKGAFLLGVLDDTETLRENQIFCKVSSTGKPIVGTCIVFRNPCFHPGDIRIVEGVECKALDHLMDVVVFPAIGYRDIPSECSGGDLDGDDFTVIYDERLIPSKVHDPMNYEAQKPNMVDCVTMEDIKKFFVQYIFADQLGMIANAHLAKADFFEVGALHGQCQRLAQLHSDAVDFPKTGRPPVFPPELRATKFPDFMEKADKPSYKSEKVLGVLYRSIDVTEEFTPRTSLSFDDFDERLFVEGYEFYLEEARIHKRAYDENIKGLMNQFGIITEIEVTSGYIVNTITKVDKKKPRDIAKSVMDALIPIKRRYRKLFEQEFYGNGSTNILPESRSRLESKAYAWYYVTYHPSELGDDLSENMISFPWLVHDYLCEIAIRNINKVKTLRASMKPKSYGNDDTVNVVSNHNRDYSSNSKISNINERNNRKSIEIIETDLNDDKEKLKNYEQPIENHNNIENQNYNYNYQDQFNDEGDQNHNLNSDIDYLRRSIKRTSN